MNLNEKLHSPYTLQATAAINALSHEVDTSDAVFLSERGDALDRKQISYLMKRYGNMVVLDLAPHPHRTSSDMPVATHSLMPATIYTETNVGRFMGFWRQID